MSVTVFAAPSTEAFEYGSCDCTVATREQTPATTVCAAVMKVSLLADWNWGQVWSFVAANGLSYLPQYDSGYLSIGCQPLAETGRRLVDHEQH